MLHVGIRVLACRTGNKEFPLEHAGAAIQDSALCQLPGYTGVGPVTHMGGKVRMQILADKIGGIQRRLCTWLLMRNVRFEPRNLGAKGELGLCIVRIRIEMDERR